MSDNYLRDLLVKEKPNLVLKHLRHGETYGTELSRKIDSTYAHTTKLIGELTDLGLIETETVGRKNMLSLTEDGEELAEAVLQYLNTIQRLDRELS